MKMELSFVFFGKNLFKIVSKKVAFLLKISYNLTMHNWSVNTNELKKDKKQYTIWRLEQMVNFGLEGKKINRIELKKYWDMLDLDLNKKQYLKILLWPKQF